MKKPSTTQAKANSSKGGKKGGVSRATKLSPQQRSAIAKQGAEAKHAKGK